MSRVRGVLFVASMMVAVAWMSAAGAVQPAGSPTVREAGSQVCELPAEADISAVAAPVTTVSDIHPTLLWLEDDLTQKMLENASRLVESQPQHFAGTFIDYQNQTLVVLRTADRPLNPVALSRLQATIDRAPAEQAAFEAEQARINLAALDDVEREILEAPDAKPLPKPAKPPALRIEIREACRSHQHLPAVADAIAEGFAGRTPMLIGVDPVSTTVMVTLDPADAASSDVATELQAIFGEDLTIVRAPLPKRSVGGRYSDHEPHLGGAQINGDCSTGFAVDRDGGRWITSAGHCFSDEWQGAYSGSEFVGVSRHRSFPDPDVTLIGSGRETFRRTIYVDPCCPSTRLVTAKGVNWVGQSICASGSVSTARCGGIVQNPLNNQFCDSSGCTNGLRIAVRPDGQTIAQPGDSGGPIYSGLSNNRAMIRGIIVAGNHSAPFDEVWFHSVAAVEAGTNSTVATACCDNDSW